MNARRMLLTLEYEWLVFRIYRFIIHCLIRKKIKLSSAILCWLNNRLNKHSEIITITKDLYEKKTGKVIVFYK